MPNLFLSESVETKKVKYYLAKGQKLTNGKNYKDAIIAFNMVFYLAKKLSSSDFRKKHFQFKALMLRGHAFACLKNYSSAICDFTRVLDIEPTYCRALELRGKIYKIQHRFIDANDDFKKILEIDPNYKEPKSHKDIRMRFELIDELSQQLETQPEDYTKLFDRIRQYYYLRDFVSAFDDTNYLISILNKNNDEIPLFLDATNDKCISKFNQNPEKYDRVFSSTSNTTTFFGDITADEINNFDDESKRFEMSTQV